MSDTVIIHNGHCSYHGPADKAPIWATREAITEPQHPAPTISPQIDLGPVPAQIVSEGRSATPELFGEGAHENQLTCNGDVITFARKADALSSVRTWASNATSGQSAPQRNCAIGDSVPTPLTSFEDTTHAWEEGYRAGQSEVGNPTVGDLICQEAAKARKVFSGTCSAAKEAIDYLEQLLLAGRAEGKALVSSWRFRANVAEQQLFDRWRQSLAESGADAPSGDLISREAVLKIFQPETSILRKRICDDIRALPAAPIGKEIW